MPAEPQSTAMPQPLPPAPVATSDIHEHWYGWQTLAVDGAAFVIAGVGVVASDGGQGSGGAELALLAAGTYVLGGPVVHFAHENGFRGLASLGLRVATPVVFALVGYAAEDCSSGGEFCGFGGFIIGGSLGILGAIIIDAAVLAREEVPDQQPALSHLRLALDRDGAGVIAAGRF
jgi:hypothetical protein